jgi:Tol biopolymer transport system component/uncharacterized protein YjdB
MSTITPVSAPHHAARSALVALSLLFTMILITACGDSGTGPDGSPFPVATVELDPGAISLVEGDTHAFVARARDLAGRPLEGRVVTWTSSSAAVATVSPEGIATARGPGSAVIRATIETRWAESHLVVSAATVDHVELSETALTLAEGASRTIVAVAKDAAGRVLAGRAITWASNDTTIVVVDTTGRVTGRRVGHANVSAQVEGRTASAVVNVTGATVAFVGITPTALVLEIGESRQLQAIVKDALGNVLQGRTVQWSVDENATVTQMGVATGVARGYVTITAVSEGVAGSVGGTIIEAAYDHDLVYSRQSNAGLSELFILTLGTGAAPVRLNAGTVSRTPTPSPDGSRIAFAVSMDVLGGGGRIDDIYAVDRTGLNMRQLTTAPAYDDQPAWSPAGGRIAYRSWEMNGRSDIWVMNPDGSGQVNLTTDMSPTGWRGSPAWTRDGTRIAFTQSETGPAGTLTAIWTMRADGSDKRQVTGTLTGFDATPTWAPGGTHLAFIRYYAGDADISIVDANGGEPVRIPLPGLQSGPAWSPDGALIAFTQNDGTLSNIYTMQPNGSRVRLRTVDASWGGGLSPAWISRQ